MKKMILSVCLLLSIVGTLNAKADEQQKDDKPVEKTVAGKLDIGNHAITEGINFHYENHDSGTCWKTGCQKDEKTIDASLGIRAGNGHDSLLVVGGAGFFIATDPDQHVSVVSGAHDLVRATPETLSVAILNSGALIPMGARVRQSNGQIDIYAEPVNYYKNRINGDSGVTSGARTVAEQNFSDILKLRETLGADYLWSKRSVNGFAEIGLRMKPTQNSFVDLSVQASDSDLIKTSTSTADPTIGISGGIGYGMTL